MRAIEPARRMVNYLRGWRSDDYWERRYQAGGDSGWGSSGELATFKARFVNEYVDASAIRTVLEFGCGDGRQLSLARYPQYCGVDVSATAVALCQQRFSADAAKQFVHAPYPGTPAELCLSLDVIYHLVEDRTFVAYMTQLFACATRAVIIYSSNVDLTTAAHVRHRCFTSWIDEHIQGWQGTRFENPLDHHWPDGRIRADFWIYERAS